MPYDTTIQTVLAEMCIDALSRGVRRNAPPKSPQFDLVAQLIGELAGERFIFLPIQPVGSARFSIRVETDSSPGQPISLQQASQGTLSIVAMAALIYQFMKAVYRGGVQESELCNQRAIVIIDEVDAHLHPAWQGKIASLLRKHFPQIQFILTAHSPLVVAGCGAGEVSVLRRRGESPEVFEFQKDFIGARPEAIYKEVFEVADKDETFLSLLAQVPKLSQLEQELQSMRKQRNPDQERAAQIQEKVQSIEKIKKIKAMEDEQVAYESLVRENEQLKRQLKALREKPESSKP
jgi:predicted ATP-binding protein involved in virulence